MMNFAVSGALEGLSPDQSREDTLEPFEFEAAHGRLTVRFAAEEQRDEARAAGHRYAALLAVAQRQPVRWHPDSNTRPGVRELTMSDSAHGSEDLEVSITTRGVGARFAIETAETAAGNAATRVIKQDPIGTLLRYQSCLAGRPDLGVIVDRVAGFLSSRNESDLQAAHDLLRKWTRLRGQQDADRVLAKLCGQPGNWLGTVGASLESRRHPKDGHRLPRNIKDGQQPTLDADECSRRITNVLEAVLGVECGNASS
jgi:hypothetical protein